MGSGVQISKLADKPHSGMAGRAFQPILREFPKRPTLSPAALHLAIRVLNHCILCFSSRSRCAPIRSLSGKMTAIRHRWKLDYSVKRAESWLLSAQMDGLRLLHRSSS